jgi:hypothetical protein
MDPFDELVSALQNRETQRIPDLDGDFDAITPREGNACFVDGGSGVLHSTPDYAVALIRLYACTYTGSNRKGSHSGQGFCYIQKEESQFTVTFFGLNFESMILDCPDMIPEQVVDLVRKVCELKFARKLLATMGMDALLVLDGDLEAEHPAEMTAFAKVKQESKAAAVLLVGLAKTNRFVHRGVSLIRALHRKGPRGAWTYRDEGVSFTKLHDTSKYIFRLDSPDARRAANVLAVSSTDPVFIGYPYGLVEADARARVSKKEVARLQLLLDAKLSVGDELSALNAHDVLDRLNN